MTDDRTADQDDQQEQAAQGRRRALDDGGDAEAAGSLDEREAVATGEDDLFGHDEDRDG